ncbi:CYTL1 domain-containing protein isoform X3 [Scophthalmus maximus]|uniref:CYTL1 domain-containing protein isoform X3 n=1 Tax=Scophthalmus maximus TaxID=52904 RepID=UPI001FA83225|nr:CYTL1 domain-containing protein isoform X3 [Scophthalmus maximus]XP_035482343.2 CYTL1 domain-containing protein isoform X3 [Scophthalmus maximus]XP_047186451.1 CYTL1 domain-containing protein isoform X3 [Scophthalmus maximus]
MAIFNHLLLVSSLVPLVLSYPFFPPTCYTKVLSMARDLTQWAADLKRDPETTFCMAHMPELYLDVHNGCVMYKMRTYISLVEGLRERRCAYTRDVWKLVVTLRQLFIFMSEKCHGDCSRSLTVLHWRANIPDPEIICSDRNKRPQ